MATISSLGVGAGIDLQSMLTKIMAVEKAPITALDTKISATNSQVSLYGTLNSKLDALKSAADTLQFPSRLSAITATSSDLTIVSASATFNASIGNYSVEVTQLAAAQKSVSNPYVQGSTFGPGNLDFKVAGVDVTSIPISAGMTLEDVSAAINNAEIGVTATVLNTSDGNQRLILTGEESGTANAFSLNPTSTLSASGGQSDLTTFDPTKSIVAQNALMTIDGLEVSSSTNQFSNTITGVTLTVTKEGTSTISVQNDSNKIISAVQSFVDSYNAVSSFIKTNTGYNATNKSGQPFSGDATTRTVLTNLNNARTSIPSELSSATLQSLFSLGVTIQSSGQLSLDSAKLKEVIATSPKDVTAALNAYGKAFSDSVSNMQSSSGIVPTKVNSLKQSIQRFQANQDALEIRVALIEKSYRSQFTALDVAVSKMQTISSSLGQTLAKM